MTQTNLDVAVRTSFLMGQSPTRGNIAGLKSRGLLPQQNAVSISTLPSFNLRQRLPFSAVRFVSRSGQTELGTTSRACVRLSLAFLVGWVLSSTRAGQGRERTAQHNTSACLGCCQLKITRISAISRNAE
jgi:hypothetical protein